MNLIKSSFLCLGLGCLSAACSPEDGGAASAASAPFTASGVPRTVVVYFSCSGNTAKLAERIAEVTGGRTWRIEAEQPYTAADLDYEVADSRANREQQDAASRPAIKGHCKDLAAAQVVFIGYPIWWGEAPRVISTFLEQHDLGGKIVVPFCTSGSSPLGESDVHLHALAPDAQWKPGKRLSTHESLRALKLWIEGLELPAAQR